MFTLRTALWLVTTLTASSALSQQMFKVVGPDGKITFSDRPTLQSTGKVSVMHSYTLRPYVTPQTSAQLAAAVAAKKAIVAELPKDPGVPLVAPVLTQEVEDALVSVFSQAEFSRRFYNFCNATESGAKAFNGATLAWKRRNAAAIEQQNRVLMQVVSPNKRDELLGKAAALLSEEVAKIAARNAQQRLAWCAGAIAELNSGKADIVQPALMAVPIVQYRAK